MTENTTIEFKSLRKIIDNQGKLKTDGLRDLAVTCVSLANSQGGEIIFGIEDIAHEPPAGQLIQDSIINEVITRLRSLCFSVSLILKGKEKHANGSDYFIITVQPSLKSIATTSDGKVFIRVGDQCQPARSEDLVHLASEKDAFQWELQLRNITVDQLPANNIQWFCSEIRKSDRVKAPVKDMSDIELLEHYNLALNNSVTNIGVLWLGNAAQRSRLTYPLTVQYIVYDEFEKKVRKEDWNDYSKNPKEILLDIENKAVELTYFDEFPQGLFRNKIRHYDERLLRELLINAIAHKSYTISGDIFIKSYHDRLEIVNPGGLPLGITKDNILHTTYRRNPHLIRILHDLKLMEGEGTGYNLIYEITSRDAKAFPIPVSDYNTTSVTQFSKIIDVESVVLIDFIAKNYILSQKEFIVLGIVARHKKILPTHLSVELQLANDDRLRSYVNRLIEQDILVTRGVKKGTEYLINPKLIAGAKINLKPSLRTIEPHRLKALIEEDLKVYPNSKSADIQRRMSDLSIADIRKYLNAMILEGKIDTSGSKKSKTYSLAKKN